MGILAQFLLRLAFGLGLGMQAVSSRQVSSGFFRNHLYVTLGLTTLAALALASLSSTAMWLAIIAALFSYAGSVAWLYESHRLGKLLIGLVVGSAAAAALFQYSPTQPTTSTQIWHSFSILTSGAVLGLTFAAMLLGHWYLNEPGMKLAPLRGLLGAAAASVVMQAVVVGTGLVNELTVRPHVSAAWLLFVLLRWSFGICGVLALLWMAWRTLAIPNTQSATGILYVAVLGVFIGELTGLLLSAESLYPL